MPEGSSVAIDVQGFLQQYTVEGLDTLRLTDVDGLGKAYLGWLISEGFDQLYDAVSAAYPDSAEIGNKIMTGLQNSHPKK